MIDYTMSQSKKMSNSDVLFTVSDMKEGWHKDFYDTLEIFDDEVPLLVILDYRDRLVKKYIYPSKDQY